MKIYVSGTFTAQERLREEAHRLRCLGHEITGTWLHETRKPDHLSYDQWMVQLATKDVAEVFASDCIIVDLDGESTSGGRYVELGVACHPTSTMLRYTVGGRIAKGSTKPYGCFNHLVHRHFDNWAEAIDFLEGDTEARVINK